MTLSIRNWTLPVYAGTFVFLALQSIIAHSLRHPEIAFVLLPLPLLLFKGDTFFFTVIYLACYLFFFEAFTSTSYVSWLMVSDSVMVVFFLFLFFSRKDIWTISLPRTPIFLLLYVLLAQGILMTVIPIVLEGPHNYLLKDGKKILVLLTAVYFCRSVILTPKKILLLFICVMAFTALEGIWYVVKYAETGERVVTWNEIFLADGVIISVFLFRFLKNPGIRKVIIVCFFLCLAGTLLSQSRGLWLATILSLSVFGLVYMKHRGVRFSFLLKYAVLAIVLLAVVCGAVLPLLFKFDVFALIIGRMSEFSVSDIINPYSSVGYRIYESYMVLQNLSWFGHGSGAYIFLHFTQGGYDKPMYWWSIHSQYFELLHKYGIVGLVLWLGLFGMLLKQSYSLIISNRHFPAIIGGLVFTLVLNHLIVSISSSYLFKENVMFFIALLIGVTDVYYQREKTLRKCDNSNPGSMPVLP
jgi:hypothetical protein